MPTTPCFEYEDDLHPHMAAGLNSADVHSVAKFVAQDLTLLSALSEMLKADRPPSQGTVSEIFRRTRGGGSIKANEAALGHLIDQVYLIAGRADPSDLNSRRGAILELVVLAILKMRPDVASGRAQLIHNAHNFAVHAGGRIVSGYSADFAICIHGEQRVEFYGCQLKVENVDSQELMDLEDLCEEFRKDGRTVSGVYCALTRERDVRSQARYRFSHYPLVRLYTADTLPNLRRPPPSTRHLI